MAWPFSNPLSETTVEDINLLISKSVPENLHLEFKETLPTKSGSKDPWIIGESRIGDRARNRILEEVRILLCKIIAAIWAAMTPFSALRTAS